MKITKAIEIKQRYQYILQDASLPELIEADNLSIEALKQICAFQQHSSVYKKLRLPGETK